MAFQLGAGAVRVLLHQDNLNHSRTIAMCHSVNEYDPRRCVELSVLVITAVVVIPLY